MPRRLNLIGETFGRLTVIGDAGRHRGKGGGSVWVCLCSCGKTVKVRSVHLRSGHTRSCRCIAMRGGRRRHPLYGTWIQMLHRCLNPKHDSYRRYGGRGIKVCERWRSFKNFISDVGDRPSDKHQIDRKDNNGDYKPDNWRWALPVVQARNMSTNRWVTVQGQRMVLAAAAEQFGIPYWTVHARLRRGWTEEQALGLASRRRKTMADQWAAMSDKDRRRRTSALVVGRKRQAAEARA